MQALATAIQKSHLKVALVLLLEKHHDRAMCEIRIMDPLLTGRLAGVGALCHSRIATLVLPAMLPNLTSGHFSRTLMMSGDMACIGSLHLSGIQNGQQ